MVNTQNLRYNIRLFIFTWTPHLRLCTGLFASQSPVVMINTDKPKSLCTKKTYFRPIWTFLAFQGENRSFLSQEKRKSLKGGTLPKQLSISPVIYAKISIRFYIDLMVTNTHLRLYYLNTSINKILRVRLDQNNRQQTCCLRL